MNTLETIHARWTADLENHFALSVLYPLAEAHCPERVRQNQKMMEQADACWVRYRARTNNQPSPESGREEEYRETSRALLLWGIDLAILLEDVAPIAGFTVGWVTQSKQTERPVYQEERQPELSIF